jgi:hypothetical protein
MAITRKNSKSNKRMSKNTKKTSKRSNSSKRNVSKNSKVRKTRKGVKWFKGVRKMKGGEIITDVKQLNIGDYYKFIDGEDLGKYLHSEEKTITKHVRSFFSSNIKETSNVRVFFFEKLIQKNKLGNSTAHSGFGNRFLPYLTEIKIKKKITHYEPTYDNIVPAQSVDYIPYNSNNYVNDPQIRFTNLIKTCFENHPNYNKKWYLFENIHSIFSAFRNNKLKQKYTEDLFFSCKNQYYRFQVDIDKLNDKIILYGYFNQLSKGIKKLFKKETTTLIKLYDGNIFDDKNYLLKFLSETTNSSIPI